jgi:valyl-tRNA synthetase
MLDEHGSDAVRYWAASARLGTDAAFDPQNPTQIKIGRRLAIKVLNAAKFVYSFDAPGIDAGWGAVNPEGIDAAVAAEVDRVIATATQAFDEFDHAKALETAEQFFWVFCDDYLELVKERAYGSRNADGQVSAIATLRETIEVLLLLFAPFIPFATEEVWSWTHAGSVHTAAWPTTTGSGGDLTLLPLVSEALIGIRRAKTDAAVSQKTEVVSATLHGPRQLESALDDLKAVGRIATLAFVEADEVAFTDIVLAGEEQS